MLDGLPAHQHSPDGQHHSVNEPTSTRYHLSCGFSNCLAFFSISGLKFSDGELLGLPAPLLRDGLPCLSFAGKPSKNRSNSWSEKSLVGNSECACFCSAFESPAN